MATPARKTIPKKTREALWKRDCGDSMTGTCFCCSQEVKALGTWHAGHVVSRANNGADTIDNLRVVCSPCNLAMGTENMNDFKTRCYPPLKGPERNPATVSGVMPLAQLQDILKRNRG